MEKKPFWSSKTLWVNVLAAVALFVQNQYGYALSPDLQAYILILVNIILRTVTKTGISA